jgi:hypothetical protein
MLFDDCATENRRRSVATLPSAASLSRLVRALVRAVMSCLPRAGAPYRHLCLLVRRDRDGVVRATDIASWRVPARQADEIDANILTCRETGPEGVRASCGAAIGPRQHFGYIGPGDLVLVGIRTVPEADAVARGVNF